jgi:hypothetical protein
MQHVKVRPSMKEQLRWAKQGNRQLLRAIRKEEALRNRLRKAELLRENLGVRLQQLRAESSATFKEVEYEHGTGPAYATDR